jgi:PAS domain S-box-containing protein
MKAVEERLMAERGPLRVVLIEDSPSAAIVVESILAEDGDREFKCTWCSTLATGLEAIVSTGAVAVLLDLGLADSDGMNTLDAVVRNCPYVAVVVLTGFDDSAAGELAIRRGAQDYLVKGKADKALLSRALRYAVERKSLQDEATAMEDELQESKARLADIIDIAFEGLVIIDEAQNITLFNQGAEAMFGYTPYEVLGLPLATLLIDEIRAAHEGDVRGFAEAVQTRRRMGEHGGVFGKRKDGSRFPAEVSISKLARGDTVTFTAIVRDVSERKAAEDALRHSDRSLAAILETLPVGVVVARAAGDVAYVNDAARRLLGAVSTVDDLARSWERSLVAGTDQPYPPEHNPFTRALNDETGVISDLEVNQDGRRVPLRVLYRPLHDLSGRVEFGVGVLEDVGDERDAERRISQQAGELARSNEELEQFAYVASHDLSEPLRTVAGFVQLLAQRYQGRLDADADEFIGFALDGVTRMQALIQDLLTYSRVSRLEYKLDSVDAQAVVTELAQANAGPGAVTCSALPIVQADPGQLRRVLQNLIGNGLKFVPPGREPHVHVSATREGAKWRFAVKDNGIGVPPHHHERIFKMFQRLHSQDDFPGTGIGLAVCQRIIERHSGEIWVESTEGVGSTFFFTLPVPRRSEPSQPAAAQ